MRKERKIWTIGFLKGVFGQIRMNAGENRYCYKLGKARIPVAIPPEFYLQAYNSAYHFRDVSKH